MTGIKPTARPWPVDIIHLHSLSLTVSVYHDSQTVNVTAGSNSIVFVFPDNRSWVVTRNRPGVYVLADFFGIDRRFSVVVDRVHTMTYAEAVAFLAEHGVLV